MNDLAAAEAALEQITPRVVARHRDAGILTWRLLFQIESEIVAELLATGEYDAQTLNIFRAADVMGYPKDDSPATFAGHTVIPVIFGDIEEAWRQVH